MKKTISYSLKFTIIELGIIAIILKSHESYPFIKNPYLMFTLQSCLFFIDNDDCAFGNRYFA